MQGSKSRSLGEQLDGMGEGGLVLEQGAPGWLWKLSSDVSIGAIKQNI